MKAYLKNYRQSPRKVRLVADMVKGKRVSEALAILSYTPKRSSRQLANVIKSAASNAENNFKVDPNSLTVASITVDKGITLKRSMPRSRGMANPIHKHTSNVSVILAAK
jgi:large subunit ribosomal protein L22